MYSSTRILLGLLFSFLVALLAVFNFLPAVPQNPDYHHFADQRLLWNIPNTLNVLSNLPFILVGLYGFFQLTKPNSVDFSTKIIYFFTFWGILLTGLGSGYYHADPTTDHLVWDRLPMTLVFMPLLAATLGETVDRKAGFLSLFPLILLGIGSVMYWAWTEQQGRGDLRLYGIVQFYPLVVIPLLVWFFPKNSAFTNTLFKVALWYVLAKIGEYFDQECLLLGNLISGHSLKHIGAGIASYYIVRSFQTYRL